MNEGGRRRDGRAGSSIVCEVALSLVLLMGAAVMLRSLHGAAPRRRGVRSENVLTTACVAAGDAIPNACADQRVLRHGAAARPGASRCARQRARSTTCRRRAARCSRSCSRDMLSSCRAISRRSRFARSPQAICASMSIPVLRGRDVVDGDVEVLLVSRATAKLLWGEADPIGRRITLAAPVEDGQQGSDRHRRRRQAGRTLGCRCSDCLRVHA